jgi:hypothetical protein
MDQEAAMRMTPEYERDLKKLHSFDQKLDKLRTKIADGLEVATDSEERLDNLRAQQLVAMTTAHKRSVPQILWSLSEMFPGVPSE